MSRPVILACNLGHNFPSDQDVLIVRATLGGVEIAAARAITESGSGYPIQVQEISNLHGGQLQIQAGQIILDAPKITIKGELEATEFTDIETEISNISTNTGNTLADLALRIGSLESTVNSMLDDLKNLSERVAALETALGNDA